MSENCEKCPSISQRRPQMSRVFNLGLRGVKKSENIHILTNEQHFIFDSFNASREKV